MHDGRLIAHYLTIFAERLDLSGMDAVREEIEEIANGMQAEESRVQAQIAALEQRCRDLSARIAELEAYHN